MPLPTIDDDMRNGVRGNISTRNFETGRDQPLLSLRGPGGGTRGNVPVRGRPKTGGRVVR